MNHCRQKFLNKVSLSSQHGNSKCFAWELMVKKKKKELLKVYLLELVFNIFFFFFFNWKVAR